jgi:peptide/nickel transport system permease protein
VSFLVRRIGFYLLAAWASLTLNFFLPRLMPGDPAAAMFARFRGQARPEQIDAMRKAFGLSDAPLPEQYVTYLSHAVRGDFGISISSFPTPVVQVIATSLQWTILLGLVATTLGFAIGCLLGVFGAWRRGGFTDSVLPPLLLFIGSFPYFWLASLALFFLSFRWNLFPMRHAYGDSLTPALSWEFIGSVGLHLVLPAATILLVSIGGWMLGMRNTMIAILAEDYITRAAAKGPW